MPGRSLEQKISALINEAVPYGDICYRIVSQRFATQQEMLSDKGSLLKGGRYNLKGAFGVVYLACDLHTCLEEGTRASTAAGIDVADSLPRTIIGINVRISKVLDLTDSRLRKKIGVSKDVLTKTDWKAVQATGAEAITQSIGRFARAAGFEALLVPSSVWKGNNLDIIPDKLLPSSQITLHNKHLLPL